MAGPSRRGGRANCKIHCAVVADQVFVVGPVLGDPLTEDDRKVVEERQRPEVGPRADDADDDDGRDERAVLQAAYGCILPRGWFRVPWAVMMVVLSFCSGLANHAASSEGLSMIHTR